VSTTDLQAAVAALDPALRDRIGQRWAEAALNEHASIGSFARFSLQLLAVGAPPDLLADTHRAALDEVHHARLCFELAEIYLGEGLAPGPLPVDGALLDTAGLPEIAGGTVGEGCVGETVAALEARHAAEASPFPEIRRVLQLIARDEEKHAALAWRFVRWAIQEGGTPVLREVQRALSAALDAPLPTRPPDGPDDRTLSLHGLLAPAARWDCRREGLTEVLIPLRSALFAH